MPNKVGRPYLSGKLGIPHKDNAKEYNKEYQKQCRYIFTVNLSQDKDADIIDAIETLCAGNRQKAVKELIRAGIQFKDFDSCFKEG